jgi:hypothetical protein
VAAATSGAKTTPASTSQVIWQRRDALRNVTGAARRDVVVDMADLIS